MPIIKVLIVDDHHFFVDVLKICFSVYNKIEVVGVAYGGPKALELLKDVTPDIILVDFMMDEMDGLELTKKIKELGISSKIAMVSTYDDIELIKSSQEAGCSAFISKGSITSEIMPVLRRVKDGETGIIHKARAY